MTDLAPHAAADTLREVATWLDSGQILNPDDPPLTFSRNNVHGFDVLFRLYPDGRATVSHRGASWHSWSEEFELTQAEVVGWSA